jgi:hypothetical protein
VFITTIGALLYNSIKFFKSSDYLLLTIAIILIILASFVLIEAVGVLKKGLNKASEQKSPFRLNPNI